MTVRCLDFWQQDAHGDLDIEVQPYPRALAVCWTAAEHPDNHLGDSVQLVPICL